MNSSGNCNGMNSPLGHFLEAAVAAKFDTCPVGRSAARIERFDRFVLYRIEQCKGIAADAQRARLHYAKHCCRCHSRVNGVATG